MDELVSVVDENDDIIGEEMKFKCHAEKILHRGAAVICFEDTSLKKILISKRSRNKKTNPGEWCLPGGHLAPEENYEAGAKREFFEEVMNYKTIDGLEFTELFKIKKDADNDYEFIALFRTIYPGPFTPDPEEVEECRNSAINS